MGTLMFSYKACRCVFTLMLAFSMVIMLTSVSSGGPQQTGEPRPRSSPTPSPSPSPSKEQAKKTGLDLDAKHKPEPRPTGNPKLSQMVTHHNQGTDAQGTESRPSASALPGSGNTNTAKQTGKKGAKPEPRPPSSPGPKPNE
jgi:hypothetical protein